MTSKQYLTITIISAVVLLICQNTRLELAGCVCAFVLLGIMSFMQLYKYNEKKQQFSNISFKLRSNDFIWPLINCIIMGHAVFKHSFNSMRFGDFTTYDGIIDIVLFLFVLAQVSIYFFNKPIISTEGILFGDGRFIKFSEVSNIVSDNGIKNKYKKITVIYNKTGIQEFRVNPIDYERIKNHLKFYGLIEIVEAK